MKKKSCLLQFLFCALRVNNSPTISAGKELMFWLYICLVMLSVPTLSFLIWSLEQEMKKKNNDGGSSSLTALSSTLFGYKTVNDEMSKKMN